MGSKQRVHDVVIIGGGVAGLSAAKELQRHGCDDVCVVEAQNRLGGRVKQVHGIAPWALDAGAELVHGQRSTVASLLVDDIKADLVKKEYPNYVYWRDSGEIACACGEGGESEDTAVDSTFNLIEQVRNSGGFIVVRICGSPPCRLTFVQYSRVDESMPRAVRHRIRSRIRRIHAHVIKVARSFHVRGVEHDGCVLR